jgi:DNA-binding CsgD family transcriptional regulator
MEHPFPGPGLRGRAAECAVLDALVEDVRRGKSRALVLRGEAGIGKTALIEYLIASAADVTVVRAVAVETELELAYSSLHQLCAPLLGRLQSLPAPQRQALGIVFGLYAGAAPDRFLVALAVLTLLAEAAEQGPLLCVVDDAQWLDRASAMTLSFVARRVLAERLGIVFATREPDPALQQLSELEVTGLLNGEARALLRSALRFTLDERVRDQIVAETRGNPLALLELPRGLTATQLAGGFGLAGGGAVTGQLERSFVRRLETLHGDTRRLLLLAAAEPTGDPLLLWDAASRLGIETTAAVAAEEDGLLAIGRRVRFRHPLVRSAIYRSAATQDRRAIHLALAEATDREVDPDRRAWHLGGAASGPAEGVALELELAAGRAQARGGVAAAAAFLQRAVELTQDPARRVERALDAAQLSFQAGVFGEALELVALSEAGPVDEFQRARAALMRAQVAFASGLGRDAPPLLLEAARRLEPLDLELARETYLSAWGAATLAGDLAGKPVREDICRAVQALPPLQGTPRPLDLLLDGVALLTTHGHATAAPLLRRATKALADIPPEDVLRWGWIAAIAPLLVWDIEATDAIAARHVQLARDAGALAQLPLFLSQLGITRPWMGDFAQSASLIAEIDSVAAAIGSPVAPYTLLRLRALQGSEAEVSALAASALELAAGTGQGMAAAWAHWSIAVLGNGDGRYEEAASAAHRACFDTINPITSMYALPELIEAAVRAGDPEGARDALEALADVTQPYRTAFALGIVARSRALLSHGAAAEALYRTAIEQLGRTPLRTELARAHLLYGEWLRRENRRVDARAELRPAHEQFTLIGMEAFAERARIELLATGAKARKRTVETRDDLTAQERQIAGLARDGSSNPEIGAQLFLSTRTVEWHLRKVFGKLGIRSRYELAAALARLEPEPAQP